MKNFIFTLLAALSSFSVSAQFTIDTVFFEGFEGIDPSFFTTQVTRYNGDTCYFLGANQSTFWQLYPRGLAAAGDTCINVRSDYNMITPPPCQANDWAFVNQAIEITPHTWLKWWVKPASDTLAGSQFTETYGVYIADTILPNNANNANNFLSSPIFVDTIYDFFNDGYYDSISLGAYDGQRKYIGFRYFSEQKQYLQLDDLYVYEKTPVSVNEYTTITYSIYPNPANNAITVESEEMGDILIYNALGQLLQQETKTDTKQNVNIANLDAGLYIVKLQTAKGSISHKVQKQ